MWPHLLNRLPQSVLNSGFCNKEFTLFWVFLLIKDNTQTRVQMTRSNTNSPLYEKVTLRLLVYLIQHIFVHSLISFCVYRVTCICQYPMSVHCMTWKRILVAAGVRPGLLRNLGAKKWPTSLKLKHRQHWHAGYKKRIVSFMSSLAHWRTWN